jgi:hypothetical protein
MLIPRNDSLHLSVKFQFDKKGGFFCFIKLAVIFLREKINNQKNNTKRSSYHQTTMNVQHRQPLSAVQPNKLLDKENTNPLALKTMKQNTNNNTTAKKPTLTMKKQSDNTNNNNKRKFPSKIAVFEEQQEEPQLKKRRMSGDSDDLSTSASIVSMRMQLVQTYESQIQEIKKNHENELSEIQNKLKKKDSDAYYFSFMYDTAKEEVDNQTKEVEQLKAKLAKTERFNVKLDNGLREKALELGNVQLENIKLKAENLELKNAPDTDIALRDKIIQQKTEKLEELTFRNELLIQQLADHKRQLAKKEDENAKQNAQFNSTITILKSQMEKALTASADKIAQLESELQQLKNDH